jgi:ATP-dependent RNA helicase RhlE
MRNIQLGVNLLSFIKDRETCTDACNPEVSLQSPTEPEIRASFADFSLDSRLERAILDAGYESPTPVQEGVIPIALSGRDLIGTAQTGTGKTAAFVLPILQRLLSTPAKRRCTRAIVLTPTRELADQVNEAFRRLGKYTKIRSAVVYGGVGMPQQARALRTGVEVIVACPGRLIDHIERRNTDFSCVEQLVLDEADRMLDMGFLPPIRRIMGQLPKSRQSMMFSATFAPELNVLTEETMNSPEKIDIGLRAPAKTIAHALYPCPKQLKTEMVLKLLENADANSVLIFTRTKRGADRVAQQIGNAGYRTAAMHANKSQSQRHMALGDFRSGRCQILVATDIAARGLDVESISHVINYDVPDCADSYIHRIGRTGRAERGGDAITLITWEDAAVVWEIEKAFGSPIERRKVEDFDYGILAPSPEEFDPSLAKGRGHRAMTVYSTPKRRLGRRRTRA